MNIDFVKLLKLILPTFMRSGLDSIVKAVASQITSLYTDFQLWQIDIRLQAAMTCQVMYMETVLNYRLLNSFLRTIYITDGDGISVDFIVNVPSGVNVDNYRLIALIEKYKASGKRYTIGQSSITYEIEWSDNVCELVNNVFTAEWSVYLCEQFVDTRIDNLVTAEFDGTYVEATCEYPTLVDLSIRVLVHFTNGSTENVNLVIRAGSTQSNAVVRVGTLSLEAISVSPTSDSSYHYIF